MSNCNFRNFLPTPPPLQLLHFGVSVFALQNAHTTPKNCPTAFTKLTYQENIPDTPFPTPRNTLLSSFKRFKVNNIPLVYTLKDFQIIFQIKI